MSVITDVRKFYRKKGIAPVAPPRQFGCEHFQCCKRGCPKFVTAREPFIGGEYERCWDKSMPRLLFLSLDPGKLSCPESVQAQRTRQGKCKVNHSSHSLDEFPKGQHWYRTHELAWRLLKQFNPELSIEEACLYFAHTNSAKCCMNKDKHKVADKRMFEKCRAYIPGEIEALRPDILVTQGDYAKLAIESSYTIKSKCDGGILTLGHGNVRWIHSYHPNCWGRFNAQRRERWHHWSAIVGRFWNAHP